MMLEGELKANKEKKRCCNQSKGSWHRSSTWFFDESSRDEARHAKMLKGILDRYFNSLGVVHEF